MFKRKRKQGSKVVEEKGLYDRAKESVELKATYDMVCRFKEMLKYAKREFTISDFLDNKVMLYEKPSDDNEWLNKIYLSRKDDGVYIMFIVYKRTYYNYIPRRLDNGIYYHHNNDYFFNIQDDNELMEQAMKHPKGFKFVMNKLEIREPF